MKPCAIYARYSSELQRAASLEDQIRNCRQFAARMGWQVVEEHVYQDAALSGFGVEQRAAYQRLVAAAEWGELPRYVPQLTYIAIAPFTGAEDAVAIVEELKARESGRRRP